MFRWNTPHTPAATAVVALPENMYLLPALLCPDIFLDVWTFVAVEAIVRADGTHLPPPDTSAPILHCKQEKPRDGPSPAARPPPSCPRQVERLQEFTEGLISLRMTPHMERSVLWWCLTHDKKLTSWVEDREGSTRMVGRGQSLSSRQPVPPPAPAHVHPAHFSP